ncbi:hypothetical protein D3H35_16345 [Cohnella faecalis]|uniref:Uncharacterized protein n=2 Tax=Cohnella faecalis TaxID=2315694 RepID=A0A398CVV6_9BACL|nr:hypothetical protein D3H35_16345 [Cohnella faecalis]
MASDTLEELGYDPQLHEGGRLHIHVHKEDLTSALEVVQSHGGQLMEHAPAETVTITNLAYGIDDIPIPAHTVNEDWEDRYRERSSLPRSGEEEAFIPDDGSYDHFDAR